MNPKKSEILVLPFQVPSTDGNLHDAQCLFVGLVDGFMTFPLRFSSLQALRMWKWLGNFRVAIKWPQWGLQMFTAKRFKGNIAYNLCKIQLWGKRESCFTMDGYENETSRHTPARILPSSILTLPLFCLASEGSRLCLLFLTACPPDLQIVSESTAATILHVEI